MLFAIVNPVCGRSILWKRSPFLINADDLQRVSEGVGLRFEACTPLQQASTLPTNMAGPEPLSYASSRENKSKCNPPDLPFKNLSIDKW
jgi:hypothetical protein